MGIFSNTRSPERTFTHRTCHRIGCVLEHPPVSSSWELIVACIGTSELCVLQTLTEALVAQSWRSLGHPPDEGTQAQHAGAQEQVGQRGVLGMLWSPPKGSPPPPACRPWHAGKQALCSGALASYHQRVLDKRTHSEEWPGG